MSHIASVSTRLELRLIVPGGPSLPVLAGLRYAADDPWAVRVAFHTGETDVIEWLFARELLADGVVASVGEGDIRVWPALSDGERVVCLSMASPSGS